MAIPHGSIPGYKSGPILSRPLKTFITSLVVVPAVAYIYLRQSQASEEKNRRLLEEEGRRNWTSVAANQARVPPRDTASNDRTA